MSSFTEVITTNGHILYWQPEKKYHVHSSKILGMDLDWTLIKPVKGKIHPIDEFDWTLLHDDLSIIQSRIQDNYKFVIFTNQGNILHSKTLDLEGFKRRWLKIYALLQSKYNINSVYLLVSLHDDFNRKPCIGMWQFMEEKLNNNIMISRTSSLYVGDMAGRVGDYSSSDLLFALNLDIEFMVPEIFYNIHSSDSNTYNTLLARLQNNEKVFNGREYLDKFNYDAIQRKNVITKKKIMDLLDKYQCLIIFVGSPAAGKTSYYKRDLMSITNLEYLSNYTLNDYFKVSVSKFNKELEKALSLGKHVIIDNTNNTIKTRARYTKIVQSLNKQGANIKILVLKFNTSKIVTLHLNALRTKLTNVCVMRDLKGCDKHNVPAVAIYNYWKKLEEPTKTEHLDYIFEIEYEPIFTNNEITKAMFEQYV